MSKLTEQATDVFDVIDDEYQEVLSPLDEAQGKMDDFVAKVKDVAMEKIWEAGDSERSFLIEMIEDRISEIEDEDAQDKDGTEPARLNELNKLMNLLKSRVEEQLVESLKKVGT